MSKYFISIFILFSVFACSSDIYNPQPDGTSSTTSGTTKTDSTKTGTTGTTTPQNCYLNTIDAPLKSSFSYNTTALLDKFIYQGNPTFSITYDGNKNPTKVVSTQNSANYEDLTYDSKGVLIAIKSYDASSGKSLATSCVPTLNAKNQITKAVLTLPTNSIINFTIDYDANSNISKITYTNNGTTTVGVQNITFDDKTCPYYNVGLGKILFTSILQAAVVGTNFTNFVNKNNILSDKTYFNSESADTYTYEYNTQGYPTKSIATKKSAGTADAKTTEIYAFTCK